MTRRQDRREFMSAIGSIGGGAWLLSHIPATAASAVAARDEGGEFQVFTATEADTLIALADRILPGGDTPGATDAGAIWFIDAAMTGFMSEALPVVRAAIADIEARAEPLGRGFPELSDAERDTLMPAIAAEPYFNMLHLLTMAGVMSLPAHGGNRNGAGWKLIGFDDRHAWQPPFGAYDNQASPD